MVSMLSSKHVSVACCYKYFTATSCMRANSPTREAVSELQPFVGVAATEPCVEGLAGVVVVITKNTTVLCVYLANFL